MDDYLVRAVTTAGNVRGLACVTTHLVNEACQRQGASPTAAIALGRAMTGGVLMGALLKDDQRVALKFEGNGPLGKILVEADSGGGVRGGLGNPGVMLPPVNGRVDVAGALGRAGFLTVTKDIGLKRPYQGMVELYSSEIGEDLAYYLAESEQIPSAVGVAAAMAPDGSIAVAGGFLIQSLPPADEALIGGLVKGIEALSSLTDLLLQGATPEGLLALIMGDFPFEILGRQDLAFRCSCSRTRVRQVLATMDREELAATIAEEGAVEVVCEFCKTAYRFDSL